ncbi:hypothetical protein ACJZ2D_009766 [Fusarium nematophilum]
MTIGVLITVLARFDHHVAGPNASDEYPKGLGFTSPLKLQLSLRLKTLPQNDVFITATKLLERQLPGLVANGVSGFVTFPGAAGERRLYAVRVALVLGLSLI